VDCRELFVDAFIKFDSCRLNVFFQEVMDRHNFAFLENLGVPVLQTKPGRIVGVPSLR
jgi:hypothetical protein